MLSFSFTVSNSHTFLYSTNNTQRETGKCGSYDPNSRKLSSALWRDALDSSEYLNKSVDSSNKHQNRGSANDSLNSGAVAPDVILESLAESSGNWVEDLLGLWADAGCWGEDEGSSGDTSDQGEWEEGDIVVLVSSGDRWDTLEVENEGDWEVSDVSGVEDDAVDAGSQNRGVCLNREIGNDILVHDAAVGEGGGSVLWGEIAEEAEWKVGGESVDG